LDLFRTENYLFYYFRDTERVQILENTNKRYALYTWNRAITESKKENEPMDNPRILFFVIGGISFFAGNLCHEILYFSYFNLGFSFIVMLAVTLVTYRAFSFNIAYKVYSYWRLFNEFVEWKRTRVDPLKATKQSDNVSAPASAPVSARSPRKEAVPTTISPVATKPVSPANSPRREGINIPVPSPREQTDVGVQNGPSRTVSPKRSPRFVQPKLKENLFPVYSDSDSTDDDDDTSGDEVEKISPRVITAPSDQRSVPRRRPDVTDKQLFGDPSVNSDEEELLMARSAFATTVSSPLTKNSETKDVS
jgi:hypothetical protein